MPGAADQVRMFAPPRPGRTHSRTVGTTDQVGGKLKAQARMLGERGQPMNLVQFKRHDGDGDVFINTAHVAMVEPSTVGVT